MTTQVSTTNPVRSDVPTPYSMPTSHHTPARRLWAVAGIAAAVAGIAGTTASGMIDAIYDRAILGDPDAIAAKLSEQVAPMAIFHVTTVLSAVLLLVFGAGLLRRLRARLDATHLAPLVALAGLAGTAVVLIIGSGFDTEFMFGVQEAELINPANAAMYNHIVGTLPWCWVLAGVSALAVWSARRAGGVPRWMGVVSLVLGGLTVLVGISPLQYMASATAQLWLLIIAIGFAVGDRSHRDA